jgi:hypothetical protein
MPGSIFIITISPLAPHAPEQGKNGFWHRYFAGVVFTRTAKRRGWSGLDVFVDKLVEDAIREIPRGEPYRQGTTHRGAA